MDKNETYEQLQWIVGMAMTIENKIKESEELTMADYLDLETAIDGMKLAINTARKSQYHL